MKRISKTNTEKQLSPEDKKAIAHVVVVILMLVGFFIALIGFVAGFFWPPLFSIPIFYVIVAIKVGADFYRQQKADKQVAQSNQPKEQLKKNAEVLLPLHFDLKTIKKQTLTAITPSTNLPEECYFEADGNWGSDELWEEHCKRHPPNLDDNSVYTYPQKGKIFITRNHLLLTPSDNSDTEPQHFLLSDITIIDDDEDENLSEVEIKIKRKRHLYELSFMYDGAALFKIIFKKVMDLNNSTKSSAPAAPKSGIGDLEKLADLKSKGIITQEEFDAKKKQILGI